MIRTLAATALAVTALTTLGSFAGAQPAQAATARNGVCETGEFCYYFNSNQGGSVSDFTASLGDYGTNKATCYTFRSSGNGQGLCVKNNAASVFNNTGQPVTVYLNSQYGGASQTIPAHGKANLSAQLKNNNASHKMGAGQPGPTNPPSTRPTGMQNPHRGANGANGGWTPRAGWLRDKIKSEFGMTCTTYATNDRTSEHSNGNGLDCWGSADQMRKLADWTKSNAAPLEVRYVIYAQKIWSLNRAGEGWRGMPNRGSKTANHFDHVHISMQHPGYEY